MHSLPLLASRGVQTMRERGGLVYAEANVPEEVARSTVTKT